MANKRLTDLTELTTPADNDFFYIVDVSDTTESPQGTSKKIRKDKVDSGASKENIANKQNDLTPDGTGTKYPTVDAVNAKVSNIDNTSDANKPISTATQTGLNTKENVANKNAVNGYAGVGSDGKIPSSLLPSITITDTFIVTSQATQVALVAETGDVAIRTDINKTYILKGTNPALFSDWAELLTPTSAVTTVFGRNGAVTAQTGDYTTAQVTETTNAKYQTDTQDLYNDATSSIQTQLNGKAPSTGGTGYIQNQNASAQSANMWIGGNGYFQGTLLSDTIGGFSGGNTTVTTNTNGVADLIFKTENIERFRIVSSGAATFASSVSANGVFTSQAGSGDSYSSKFSTAINYPYIDTYIDSKAGTSYEGRLNFRTSSEGGVLTNKLTILNSGAATFASSVSATSFNSTIGSNFATTSGNVGIGTTSPAEKLHVYGNIYIDGNTKGYTSGLSGYRTYTKAAQFEISSYQSTGGSPYTKTMDIVSNADSGVSSEMRFLTAASGANPSEAMRIASNGNVLIGTTTDNGIANNKLQVNGSIAATSYTGGATLTGTPTAPTAAAGTNTEQIATTGFVQQAIRPYKVYTALLTQTGTNAPTAIVLENTLGGTIVWTRDSAGIYYGTLSGAFSSNKTVCFISGTVLNVHFNCYQNSTSSVTATSTNTSGEGVDTAILSASIEIRVYN